MLDVVHELGIFQKYVWFFSPAKQQQSSGASKNPAEIKQLCEGVSDSNAYHLPSKLPAQFPPSKSSCRIIWIYVSTPCTYLYICIYIYSTSTHNILHIYTHIQYVRRERERARPWNSSLAVKTSRSSKIIDSQVVRISTELDENEDLFAYNIIRYVDIFQANIVQNGSKNVPQNVMKHGKPLWT